MLCDSIISYPEESPEKLPKEMIYTYRYLGEKLKNTNRFILNRDAVMTIHSISESTPKRFLQALAVCRLPFPSLWVEFAFQDRTDWMNEAKKRGLIIETHEHASPPSRIGFYLEQLDKEGRKILVLPCWSHPKMGTVSLCHMALTICTDVGKYKLADSDVMSMQERLKEISNRKSIYLKWMNDPEEIQAGFELEARMTEEIPDFLKTMWIPILKNASKSEIIKIKEMAQYDLKAEWRFILALLTVLNSRNVVDIGPTVDVSKLNKARIRKGSKPLMNHREIKLSLSKVQKNRLNDGIGNKDIQAHLCRGHFKLRRSGLFWWSPHVRGNYGTPSVTTTTVRG